MEGRWLKERKNYQNWGEIKYKEGMEGQWLWKEETCKLRWEVKLGKVGTVEWEDDRIRKFGVDVDWRRNSDVNAILFSRPLITRRILIAVQGTIFQERRNITWFGEMLVEQQILQRVSSSISVLQTIDIPCSMMNSRLMFYSLLVHSFISSLYVYFASEEDISDLLLHLNLSTSIYFFHK